MKMSIEDANRMAAVEKKRKQGGDVMGALNLRDYFAAMAMQGLLAAWTAGVPEANPMAAAAYQYADAMLKAREA